MGWFITAVILGVIALICFIVAGVATSHIRNGEDEDDSRVVRGWAIGIGVFLVALGGLFVTFSTVYTQSVGEAKVIINLDGTVEGQDNTPGWGSKAPWQEAVDFDLFSQELLYAGGNDGAPSYSGGSVSGKEVTVTVGGVAGGTTQANVDISIVYSLEGENVTDIYSEFKSQERFTKSVIERTILSVVREVPSNYTAIEFRGTKRSDAADSITSALEKRLERWGVTDFIVNIQDVRYPESVENALKDVEVANQNVQKAEAELAAAEVSAQQKVVQAQAEADANAILNASLSDAILQQRYLDTLAKLAAEGNLVVVPEGFNGLVNVGQ